MKPKDYIYAFAAFCFLTIVLVLKVPNWFLSMGHVTLASADDGLKTYFTYLWHIKFDTSYAWFTGMNYPFGEQIMFTDNQPVLVSIARFLKMSDSAALVLLNGTILISILATAPVLFILLRRLRLPQNYCLFASVAIALLSPQIIRIPSHEGLAHPIVIPLLWLMLLSYFEKPSATLTVAIAVFTTFFAGIHPYYLLISATFTLAFWLAALWTQKLRANWHMLVQCFLPLASFLAWSRWTDPVHDRIIPLVSLGYRAYFESVFLPYENSPLRPLITSISQLHSDLPVECRAYVGISGFLLLFGLVFRIATRLKRTKNLFRAFRFTNRLDLRVSLIAAVIVLLYSLGYPWTILGEDAFRKMGALAQFRSLGRFAWVFYYVFTVYMFYAIYWFAKVSRLRWLVPAFLALYAFESLSYSIPILNIVDRHVRAPNALLPNAELDQLLQTIDAQKYQALIPIPFFQHGSETAIPETIRSRPLPITLSDAIATSYKLGLPMMAQSLSRSSAEQSRAMFAIFTGDALKSSIIEKLDAKRAILVIRGAEPLEPAELALLQRATKIRGSIHYEIYEINPLDL